MADCQRIWVLPCLVVTICAITSCHVRVAVAEEVFANVRADETRAAGDQKIHG
jgi:hypothetical protein